MPKKLKGIDLLTIFIIILLMVTAIAGLLSFETGKGYIVSQPN